MTKYLKKLILFWINNYLGLQKGRPSYRRSLQPSKDNIQRFKSQNMKFLNFFCFCGSFCPPRFGSGSTDLIESGSSPDLDTKHWMKPFLSISFAPQPQSAAEWRPSRGAVQWPDLWPRDAVQRRPPASQDLPRRGQHSLYASLWAVKGR